MDTSNCSPSRLKPQLFFSQFPTHTSHPSKTRGTAAILPKNNILYHSTNPLDFRLEAIQLALSNRPNLYPHKKSDPVNPAESVTPLVYSIAILYCQPLAQLLLILQPGFYQDCPWFVQNNLAPILHHSPNITRHASQQTASWFVPKPTG